MPIWRAGAVVSAVVLVVFRWFYFFAAETGIYNEAYCIISGELGHKPVAKRWRFFFGGFEKQITEDINFELNRTVDLTNRTVDINLSNR